MRHLDLRLSAPSIAVSVAKSTPIVKPDRVGAIDGNGFTCDLLIGGFFAPLDGITRFMLLSSNGVVIMK